ncbi:MAG: DNA-binding protein [Candidatus Scalindua sp.]
MIKQVAILSFILMLAVTISVNCTYASQYSLSNKDEQAGSQAFSQEPLVGKVAETMNSGGYTYILLQTKTKMSWVAIAETKVDVGQAVVLSPGMEMIDFHSKSLNRTFDSIIFSEGLITEGGAVAGQGSAHGSAGAQEKTTLGSKGAKPTSKENIKVEKATGDNAYTVAELFEKRKELDNKDIVLRGEVVKVTPQIMQKNWLHIQDGSGDPQAGTNDIVVTTMDLPTVGDTVTVKGVLFSDKDFGSGYRYDAIVEFGQVSE